MTHSDIKKEDYVRHMFARIANQYDLINRLMTWGFDVRWRKEVVALSRCSHAERILDLGSGTGDIALDALRACPGVSVVGGDFTITMMRAGKSHPEKAPILWAGCDAQNLPFPDRCFDAVVSGFLLRNVGSIERTLREHWRVLKSGGRLVALDTTRPPNSILGPGIRFYLNRVIPLLGGVISKNQDAYQYLPASTAAFLSAEQLAVSFAAAGFVEIKYVKKMFGTVAIHWASKPIGM